MVLPRQVLIRIAIKLSINLRREKLRVLRNPSFFFMGIYVLYPAQPWSGSNPKSSTLKILDSFSPRAPPTTILYFLAISYSFLWFYYSI
ncbi:hypothetical protein DSY1557 [Desulfitobacterium hafniense Y51]|uniref:Uncharacterized protein n=1 Tax=Desulfitobacterium hafniense (strain Y51) TaxID=138119 RepID=Q24X96_DESHY|nr:hypothetical protein DSY1557 [Desulfitobacterium hafniense Y51]